MTREEARSAIMGAISMALKDPTLQQGFEIICKNLAELEKENAELRKDKKELCHSISEGGKACVYLKEQLEISNKVYNDNLDYSHHIEEQLTKAKELLNEFMRISKASDEDFEHDYSGLIGEAEQFIKDSEVKNDSKSNL